MNDELLSQYHRAVELADQLAQRGLFGVRVWTVELKIRKRIVDKGFTLEFAGAPIAQNSEFASIGIIGFNCPYNLSIEAAEELLKNFNSESVTEV